MSERSSERPVSEKPHGGSRLLLILGIGAVVVLLVLGAFWAGTMFGPGRPTGQSGTTEPGDRVVATNNTVVDATKLPDPPPPAKPVPDPDRVKQNLKPGKTYVTHSRGTLNARGTDKSWGLETEGHISFMFDADVDRTIEKNDGNIIVE